MWNDESGARGRQARMLLLPVIAAAVLAAGMARPAAAQYTLNWHTCDGGGALGTMGGTLGLSGTIGQPDAGTLAGGAYSLRGGFWVTGLAVFPVDVTHEPAPGATLGFALHGGVPNPLVQSTDVAFDLPRPGAARLQVFDTNGRLARTLFDGWLPAGRHRQSWNGVDLSGRPVAAGIYFVRLEAGSSSAVRKLTVLR